jgi:hypothetical protein
MSTGCTARAAIDAKFREVELDLEYVVRCVDEIRHVGSPARAARCRPGEGERLQAADTR